jgi:hypothetical protein
MNPQPNDAASLLTSSPEGSRSSTAGAGNEGSRNPDLPRVGRPLPLIRFELCERMSERVRKIAAIGGSSVERVIMAALRSYVGNPCNDGTTK